VKVPATLPAGYDAALTVKALQALPGITAPAAQALFDAEVKRFEASAVEQARRLEVWDAQVKADPRWGADVAKTQALAQRGLKALGGADLAGSTALRHPAILKAFALIGEQTREDNAGGGAGTAAGGELSESERLRALYPSMFNSDGSPKY
jgi:hypothetical protein